MDSKTLHDETETQQAPEPLLAKSKAVVVRNGKSAAHPVTVAEEDEPRYGWSKRCSPDSIQFLRNKKVFLVIFCLTCVIQGMFSTYFVAVITTLEKLFSIHSKMIGSLLAATEIGQVSSSLLLPYFVGTGHRPRWIGICAALISIASLMCASPHVLLPIPAHFQQYGGAIEELHTHNSSNFCIVATTNTTNGTCYNPQGQEEAALEQHNSKSLLFGIFFLSMLTIGLGQTAVYTLGIPYLDDNVTNRDSPLYFSITIGVKILGPVLGFILGSLCVRLYVIPNIDPGFSTNHVHWLGAWWLGMVLISILLFVSSILMFGFPVKLSSPKPKSVGLGADAVVSKTPSPPPVVQTPKKSFRNFPVVLKRLLINKMLLLRTFSSVFHLLPVNGLYTFLPKYFENQFRVAASEAAMITGIGGILVMGFGIFASGIYIKKYSPNAKTIARWIALCALVYSCGMFVLTTIGCDDTEFIDSSFGQPQCEDRGCSCSNTTYAPICGSDGKTYFSACFAGCPTQVYKNTKKISEGGVKMLENCACINDTIQTATEEFCKPGCVSNINFYLVIFVSIVLLHSTSEVGSMLLTLRCVEPRDKAMALGLIQASIGLIGNVPCQIIYGAIVDYTCILFSKISCSADGALGHCWIYDTKLFRQLFHGATGSLMFIAFLIDIVVYYKADSINLINDAEEEDGGAVNRRQDGLNANGSLKSIENIPMLNITKDSKPTNN